MIVDRRWDIVSANSQALSLFTTGVDPALLEPPINAYRLGLHPHGLAPRVRNLSEYAGHLLTQLQRDAAVSGDPDLAALFDEVRAYPGMPAPSAVVTDPAQLLFLPMRIEAPDGVELSLFSTIATFGTALDITVSELSIEAFFPADQTTRSYLTRRSTGLIDVTGAAPRLPAQT